MAKPQLSNYPALLQVLRSNTQANTEFNAYVSSITTPGAAASREKDYEEGLAAERTRADEADSRAKKAEAVVAKSVRFIRVLGEVIESQLRLNPYVQDVAEKKRYEISFSAGQVRMAVRWYWDVLSSKMEDVLATSATPDPIEDET
jgi:hypothetical protein